MIVQSVNLNWEYLLISLAYQASGRYNTVDQSLYQAPDHQALCNAYALCAMITARYSPSFHYASALLPRTKRQSVRALYTFCRLVDDLVDGEHLHPKQVLEQLRERLSIPITPLDKRDPTSEILLGWAVTRAGYHIPQIFIDQLLDGGTRFIQKPFCYFRRLGGILLSRCF